MTTPEQAECPQVSTEPQRQALDAMSRDLLRKLNTMVEEQNERARQFARTEHSLTSTPMGFELSLPELPPTPSQGAPAASQLTVPPEEAGQPRVPSTPPPPPQPLLSDSNAQEAAAQRRAQILQKQREQRRAEQEAEEERRQRIREAQEEADSAGALLEFLGLKKAPRSGEPSGAAPSPRNPEPQAASAPSCGCSTLFIVIAVILIILKVISSMD